MKKIVLFILFLFCLVVPGARAQNGLRVDSLFHFPQMPADTAYSNQFYNIDIAVHNYDTSVFTGSIAVLMQADTLAIDTLRSDTTTIIILAPGADTVLDADTNFHFDAVNYAAGDNIVVVWPSLRVTFPIDSIHIDVHFVLVSGLNDPEAKGEIILYPVPARHVLKLEYDRIETIEQVRIYSQDGRLLLDTSVPPKQLDVTSYAAGLYYISILRHDGTRIVKKILKQ